MSTSQKEQKRLVFEKQAWKDFFTTCIGEKKETAPQQQESKQKEEKKDKLLDKEECVIN